MKLKRAGLFHLVVFLAFVLFTPEGYSQDTSYLNGLAEKAKRLIVSYPDSARSYNEVLLADSRKQKFIPGISSYYFNRGMLQYYAGNFRAGLQDLENALRLKTALHDLKGIAGCYNNMGLIYGDMGNNEAAITNYYKSMKIKEQIGDKKGLSSCYNNIGIIKQNQQKFNEALGWYLKAMKVSAEIKDNKQLGFAYNNIGPCYLFLKEYNKGLEYLFKGLRLKNEIGDPKGIASSKNNIGIFYTEIVNRDSSQNFQLLVSTNEIVNLGRNALIDSAKKFHEEALILQTKAGDKKGQIYSQIGIAQTLVLKKQYHLATEMFLSAKELALEINARNKVKDIHHELYTTYKLRGDYGLALQNFELFKTYSDSLINIKTENEILKKELTFEFDKKEQAAKLKQQEQALLAREELNRQKYISYSGIAGAILLFGFSLAVFGNLRQKKKANQVLQQKNEVIEEKNKDITDSINYAQQIQQALLPFDERIRKSFPDFFVFFRPRDIVSGDFYWFHEKNDVQIIAVVDCTGHGVPGAFMSMIGNALLNDIVGDKGITDPGEILTLMNKGVRHALKQDETSSRDGMDMVLCSIDRNRKMLGFAGAVNSLLLVNEKKVSILKGLKHSIGGFQHEKEIVFTTQFQEITPGLQIYLSSDGYVDQFGGPDGKKFKSRQFKAALSDQGQLSMKEQGEALEKLFMNWKGDMAQVDDVCVMGIRL